MIVVMYAWKRWNWFLFISTDDAVKDPKGGRHGKKNHEEYYNEQPATPVAEKVAAQASGGGGFWSFVKNVVEVVHIGIMGG